MDGEHLAGDPPSKELVLHRALYRRYAQCGAVAHLHSPSAVAVSCLTGLSPVSALPPLTPYFVMRVGRLRLVDYAAPGSEELERSVSDAAQESPALLLRNHGSLVAARTLEGAVDAVEEIEATARIFLDVGDRSPAVLGDGDVTELLWRYPALA